MAKIVKRLPRYHHSLCVTKTLNEVKQIAKKIENKVENCNLKIFDYRDKPVKLTDGSEVNFALLVPAANYKKVSALDIV